MPASASASADPPVTASCAGSASRPISRPAALRRARPSARSAAASACGIRRSAGQSDRLGRSPHRLPPARPGHETTFAQVVSERLGIPFDNVGVVHGDTDKVQFGMGTYGSRSGAVGISAIVKALDKVEAKAKKVAAQLLEAAEGDIVFKDGKFTIAGTDKSAAWGDVMLNAYIAHKFAGQELRAGIEGGRVLRSHQLHLPGRLPHLRGRGRSRDRRARSSPGPRSMISAPWSTR